MNILFYCAAATGLLLVVYLILAILIPERML